MEVVVYDVRPGDLAAFVAFVVKNTDIWHDGVHVDSHRSMRSKSRHSVSRSGSGFAASAGDLGRATDLPIKFGRSGGGFASWGRMVFCRLSRDQWPAEGTGNGTSGPSSAISGGLRQGRDVGRSGHAFDDECVGEGGAGEPNRDCGLGNPPHGRRQQLIAPARPRRCVQAADDCVRS